MNWTQRMNKVVFLVFFSGKRVINFKFLKMDKLVKGLVLMSTIALILNLFDFFGYDHTDWICYALLIFSGIYFLIRKYCFRNESNG